MYSDVTNTILLEIYMVLKILCSILPLSSDIQNLFAADLLSIIVDKKSSENVVYSPSSIQTALALVYMGATGETQEDMRKVLKIRQDEDKSLVAQRYGKFLKSFFGKSKKNAPQLKMINCLYVNDRLKILAQYNKIAQNHFQTKIETLDFNKGKEVAEKINTWVEQETENKIKYLLPPDAVNKDTSAILINAIYFKGKWLSPFSKDSTTKHSFHTNNKETQQVDMMYQDGFFRYRVLPELEAKALELRYENSDISMLIILPDNKEGLPELENKLKGVDLNEITRNFKGIFNIELFLPKFCIEFDIDLEEPLKKLGLNTMFSQTADFSELFDSSISQKISVVKHKAFLYVNEAGSEAVPASFVGDVSTGLAIKFIVDHPFFFAIRSESSVYLAGHVSTFE